MNFCCLSRRLIPTEYRQSVVNRAIEDDMIDFETPFWIHSAQNFFCRRKSFIEIINMSTSSQMCNCLSYPKVRHLDKVSTTSLAISIITEDTIDALEGSDKTHDRSSIN